MGAERPDHTLEPTALVHEAWLRLSASRNAAGLAREEFLGLAAQAMRRILTDHARRRAAQKRGGEARRTTLSGVGDDSSSESYLVDVDAALTELEATDPELARLVELRFFGGASTAATAAALGISERTAKRRWRFARAWLQRRMTEDRE